MGMYLVEKPESKRIGQHLLHDWRLLISDVHDRIGFTENNGVLASMVLNEVEPRQDITLR